jgi:xeroderma pigmentosum group C-complementing protein
MFEAFMRDLVVWWAHRRFRLEPNMTATAALRQPNPDALAGAFPPPGGRVDGWVVESAAERDERWRQERAQRQAHARELAARSKEGGASRGKGKEKAIDVDAAPKAPRQACPDITLFGPGANSVTPTYLHLAPSLELIISPESLLERHEARNGSRETSAQLFCSMCRALGIPARLVISVQVAPWSIGAAKVATTTGAIEKKPKRSATGTAKLPKAKQIQENRKPEGEYTSDEDEWELGDGSVAGSAKSPAVTPVKARTGRQAKGKAANGTASRPASIAGTASGTESLAHRSDVELSVKSKRSVARSSVAGSAAASPAQPSKTRKPATSAAKGQRSRSSSLSSADGDASTSVAGDASKGKAKDQAADEEDPRARWANGPIEVEHVPRLRRARPKKLKATELEADAVSDVEVVDTEAPPTMWVEVFSKPWQKWLTVDPVRGRLEPAGNRHMEPAPSDRTNRLVYVVAFEEDGFARDVTARYTKTLHSRVSRMRPPPIGKGAKKDAWWASVIAALHRPQHLDRDAAEDVELEEAAGKEPMPSSVGGFKDHPVFAIEKHLKRDEVIHPLHQIGTFQGIKVYPRGNVVSCRSARQWYNEGRVVSDGQEALKWVKSRGYTLANKRAEEQARAEGGESPMEGLYAENQTELYQAPPVVDGEVPKNSFGNIDLFVPTMLPAGAAHIPYNGAGKVAKKLGISYAEAIVSRVQRLLELGLTRLSADWLRIPQVPQHAAPDGHRRARGVRGPRR